MVPMINSILVPFKKVSKKLMWTNSTQGRGILLVLAA